jgi:hypothetical protein
MRPDRTELGACRWTHPELTENSPRWRRWAVAGFAYLVGIKSGIIAKGRNRPMHNVRSALPLVCIAFAAAADINLIPFWCR